MNRTSAACLLVCFALALPSCNITASSHGEISTSVSSVTVSLPGPGDPVLLGQRRSMAEIVDFLRAQETPLETTVQLLRGTPAERLWEVWTELAEELPVEVADRMTVELPLAAGGDEYLRLEEPPPFVILAPEEVGVGSRGGAPRPLASTDELPAVAAGFVLHDPNVPFVLVAEGGAGAEALEAAAQGLLRGRAERIYLLGKDGLVRWTP